MQRRLNFVIKIIIMLVVIIQAINIYGKLIENNRLKAKEEELKNRYDKQYAENDKMKDPEFLAKKAGIQNSQTREGEIIFTIPEE